MLIVNLNGGLGNQMFQYAFGRKISQQWNLPLKLDIFDLNQYRKYELSIFTIEADFATKKDMLLFDRRSLSLAQKVVFQIKNAFSKPAYLVEEIGEGGKAPSFAKSSKHVLIKGHWQNEKYFKSIEPTIRQEFSFPDIKDEKNREIKRAIEKTNSVAIHVRRGDYKLEQNKVHGILPLDYYKSAIEYISSKLSDPFFFIISDDHEWVREHFSFCKNVIYVDNNQNNLAYVDMQLMSYCQHNIIANSSFSWWGAWLNNNVNKIVIAPERWFADPLKNAVHKNLVPKEWIRL